MQTVETLRRRPLGVLAAASALLVTAMHSAPALAAAPKMAAVQPTIEEEALAACSAAGYASGGEALGCVAGFRLGANRRKPPPGYVLPFPSPPGSGGGGSTIMRPTEPDWLKMQLFIDDSRSTRGGGTELQPR